MSDDIVILGAGLAGLSCAHHLGGDYRIFERETEPGGVARSFSRNGFHFDVTGHWLHLRDDGISQLVQNLMAGELQEIERRATIHSHGVSTPYPFQANTYGLPVDVVTDCVLGYFHAREAAADRSQPEPRSFEDYIRQRMGDGIADHFMIPYNTKLWTVPPSEMAHAWCGRFVPIPKPEEVVQGALAPAGAGHRMGYNATFLYPKSGGIGRLPAVVSDNLPRPPEFGMEVMAVDFRGKKVRLADGTEHAYRILVSTMPLNTLAQSLVEPPDAIRDAAAKLRAASVTYWDVGVAGKNTARDSHWTYFPESNVPFYRAGSASAAAPHVAPENHRSYYVEVSHPQGQPCPASEPDILTGMRRVGLLGENEEPVLLHRTTVPCAYVIMDHAYGEARQLLIDWLRSQNIWSIGRYGAWTYDSMEGAMVQGRQAAKEIREQSP